MFFPNYIPLNQRSFVLKKNELMKMVGQSICVEFKDGTAAKGILGYTPEFSAQYDYRAPDYFFINNLDFKVSYVKKITS